ncbi:MAG TPA: hypothetical protein PKH07_11095, partial [bacterium]|nr:hypothetical protein [bacterium]
MMRWLIILFVLFLIRPVALRASDELSVTTHVAHAVRKESALDVSFLLDAPAGKHGATRAEGNRLCYANGTPARFWGVNFAWEAQYPEVSQIDAIVKRLGASGINLVRLTYLDHLPPKGLVSRLAPTEIVVSEERFDRLDRFATALFEAGIYVNVVLLMNGKIADITPSLESNDVASLQMFHPDVIAAHERWIEFFLSHRNPYTGRTWGEEPGLAFIEIYNEGDPFYLRKKIPAHSEPALAALHEKWRQWCQQESFEGSSLFDLTLLDGRLDIGREPARFLSDLQRSHLREMRAVIRRCGYTGAICDIAGGSYAPAARWAQRESDVHVAHYYHDHPNWDEKGALFHNRSGCESGLRMLTAAAWERDLQKPYILGEWDFC